MVQRDSTICVFGWGTPSIDLSIGHQTACKHTIGNNLLDANTIDNSSGSENNSPSPTLSTLDFPAFFHHIPGYRAITLPIRTRTQHHGGTLIFFFFLFAFGYDSEGRMQEKSSGATASSSFSKNHLTSHQETKVPIEQLS